MSIFRTALFGALILLAAACTRLTEKNYEKLKVGMTYEEVTQILGSPDRSSDVLGVKSCQWGNDKRSVTVNFLGDKAVVFTSQNLR